MTSSRTEKATGGSFACSAWWTSSREALAIRVARQLGSADVIDVLADLFIARGIPAHIRLDQGAEFVAKVVKGWIGGVGAATAYIEKGSPWENGYVESFNGMLRDELLNGEVFHTRRRGARADRALAAALQRRAPAFVPRLPPASPRGHAIPADEQGSRGRRLSRKLSLRTAHLRGLASAALSGSMIIG
jgi:transposase InsO family protein